MERRQTSLDVLKGVAMLAIILCHISQLTPDKPGLMKSFFSLGQYGCQCFFVVTGWMTFRTFDENIPNWVEFFFSKIKRIIVPWYIIIGVYFAIGFVCLKMNLDNPFNTSLRMKDILVNIAFLNGLFPFANNNVVLGGWYVGSMVLIWSILPFLGRFIIKAHPKRNTFFFILACLAAMVCYECCCGTVLNNSFQYFFFVNQLSCVLIGGLLFQFEKDWLSKSRHSKRIIFSFAIGITGMVLKFSQLPFSHVFAPFLLSIFWGVFFSIAVEKKGTGNFIISKLFAILGKYSLFIYLSHVLIAYHIQYFLRYNLFYDVNSIVFFVVFSICSIPIIIGFGFLFEKVSSMVKKSLMSKIDS